MQRAFPALSCGNAPLRVEIEENLIFPSASASQSRKATASALFALA
jgi:hypothetical protein